jgi:hypothetical protein
MPFESIVFAYHKRSLNNRMALTIDPDALNDVLAS